MTGEERAARGPQPHKHFLFLPSLFVCFLCSVFKTFRLYIPAANSAKFMRHSYIFRTSQMCSTAVCKWGHIKFNSVLHLSFYAFM